MSSKICVKFGELNIEFEGTEDFIKEGLLQFTKEALGLLKEEGSKKQHNTGGGDGFSEKQPSSNNNSSNQLDMSVASIMSKIGGDGGPDLALAAAAYLTFVSGQATFSRVELLAAMKTATSFYTDTMSSNLSRTLDRLTKESKFVQKGNKNYAIQNAVNNQLQSQLLAD